MPEGITYQSLAIAPGLVRNWEQAFSTRAHGLRKHRIRVRNIHIESETGAAQGLRRPVAIRDVGVLVGEKEQGVADAHLGVCYFSIRAGNPEDFLTSKSFLVEFEGPGCTTHSQRGCQSMMLSSVRTLGI